MSGRAWTALALDVPRRLARGRVLIGLIFIVIVAAGFLGGSTTVEVVETGKAALPKTRILLFGTQTHAVDGTNAVEPLLYHLSIIFVGLWGTILLPTTLLVLTADAVVRAFQPGAAEITLTKPIGRWEIVASRALGAVGLACAMELLLLGGAAGAAWGRTGVPTIHLLAALPALGLSFAVMHALATLSGTMLRNSTWGLLGGFGGLILSVLLSMSHWIVTSYEDAVLHTRIYGDGAKLVTVVRDVFPRLSDGFELAFRLGSAKPFEPGDQWVVLNLVLWMLLPYCLTILIVRSRDH